MSARTLIRRLDSLLWGEDVGNHGSEDANDGRHNAGDDDCQWANDSRDKKSSDMLLSEQSKYLEWETDTLGTLAISSYIRIWRWPCTTAWPSPCLLRRERSRLGHWRLPIIPTGTTMGRRGGYMKSVITVSRVCLAKQRRCWNCFCFFYHVGYNGQLVYDGLGAQLGLADHSRQEAPHLEQPPLQAEHEHAGDGQLDEGPPLLQALHGPPCVWQRARGVRGQVTCDEERLCGENTGAAVRLIIHCCRSNRWKHLQVRSGAASPALLRD